MKLLKKAIPIKWKKIIAIKRLLANIILYFAASYCIYYILFIEQLFAVREAIQPIVI